MNERTNNTTAENKKSVPQERKPNESAGFHFSSSIKISDPNTGQVLVQKRAD